MYPPSLAVPRAGGRREQNAILRERCGGLCAVRVSRVRLHLTCTLFYRSIFTHYGKMRLGAVSVTSWAERTLPFIRLYTYPDAHTRVYRRVRVRVRSQRSCTRAWACLLSDVALGNAMRNCSSGFRKFLLCSIVSVYFCIFWHTRLYLHGFIWDVKP